MEALHARLLAAAGDHQLHHVIANLLAPPTVSILARLSVLATFIRIVTPEDFVGLNADHETPYEALKQVTKWVHGPDFVQEALANQTLLMVMRATPLVWTALQMMPPQPAATALAIRALRQGGVNPLLHWAEDPRPLIAAWNEVAEPALRAALADAILRSAPRMQAVTAEVVDAVTHQLPQPLAHETAKALVEHHVHVLGEPQLSLETFLGERNGAFAMAFHHRLGAASEARHAEAVEAMLRQYL